MNTTQDEDNRSSKKAAQPQFSSAALEQLIPGSVTPVELEGIFQQFKEAVLERALDAPRLDSKVAQNSLSHPYLSLTIWQSQLQSYASGFGAKHGSFRLTRRASQSVASLKNKLGHVF